MVARVNTLAFEGVEARPVDVQVQISGGTVAFTIVGLGDKAVGESRERVRSALIASGLSMPAKRITVNLAPADMPKEGSHYDLPIALAVLAAIGAIPSDALEGYAVLGELALDGSISAVAGVLPAAIAANARGLGLICPSACGGEAAWASSELDILAPRSLIQLANHFRGTQVLARPAPALRAAGGPQPDLRDIKGQENAKRALEVAAAGGHNLLMSGSPGAGKSMLAQRLPSILPPLAPRELLEVSMIHSIAGKLANGELTDRRPFRSPHHSASMAALVGGGIARQTRRDFAGPQWRAVSRRTRRVPPAGARRIAAADGDRRGCDFSRQPSHRLSRPLPTDRGDEPVPLRQGGRARLRLRARPQRPLRRAISEQALRSAARSFRPDDRRARGFGGRPSAPGAERGLGGSRHARRHRPRRASRTVSRARDCRTCSATPARRRASSRRWRRPTLGRSALLRDAAERMRISARGFHRVLKLARTLADLEGADAVRRAHIAEALSYRSSRRPHLRRRLKTNRANFMN